MKDQAPSLSQAQASAKPKPEPGFEHGTPRMAGERVTAAPSTLTVHFVHVEVLISDP